MPNTKKVFQIEINGLTQSVDAVKALNDQLKDLESRISRLEEIVNGKSDITSTKRSKSANAEQQ